MGSKTWRMISTTMVYSEQIDIAFDQEELPDSGEEVHENHPYQRNRMKDLKDRERQDIYVSNNGKLKKNSTSVIAYRFNVIRCTVSTCMAKGHGMPCNWCAS